jgi:dienelactone hydrolase
LYNPTGVVHGFTNFNSPDAYDEWVDKRSWLEMSSFLQERFGDVEYGTIEPEAGTEYTVLVNQVVGTGVSVMTARMADAKVTVQTVSYDDAGFALEGYLAMPPAVNEEDVKVPGLLILPDWDGVNGPTGYEAGRAVMAAKNGGYVAMVADIYGSNYTNVEDMGKRVELATMYRSDPELFVGRIQAGVDQLVAHPSVDSSNIFVAGYCLGGTGAIDYGFSGEASLKNVKAVVPIHGGLTPLRAIQSDAVQPYVLILSGGVDDAHGNATELEAHLDGASATWEISRYSSKDCIVCLLVRK